MRSCVVILGLVNRTSVNLVYFFWRISFAVVARQVSTLSPKSQFEDTQYIVHDMRTLSTTEFPVGREHGSWSQLNPGGWDRVRPYTAVSICRNRYTQAIRQYRKFRGSMLYGGVSRETTPCAAFIPWHFTGSELHLHMQISRPPIASTECVEQKRCSSVTLPYNSLELLEQQSCTYNSHLHKPQELKIVSKHVTPPMITYTSLRPPPPGFNFIPMWATSLPSQAHSHCRSQSCS